MINKNMLRLSFSSVPLLSMINHFSFLSESDFESEMSLRSVTATNLTLSGVRHVLHPQTAYVRK